MKTGFLCGFMLLATMLPALPAAPVLAFESPSVFFTNAADQMLRYSTAQWRTQNFTAYTNTFGPVTTNAFGCGNIPVYVGGRFVYSPAVNRLLQLAANVYDAATTNFYPSVFRPIFFRDSSGNVFVSGYQQVVGVADVGDAQLSSPIEVSALPAGASANVNVYGVPWIIGAKKGFPNFNQFHMRNGVQVTRKLQVTRTNPLLPGAVETNQMFVMSITNQLGFSFWNSYESNYVSTQSGGINVVIRDALSMVLSNGTAPNLVNKSTVYYTNISLSTWPGSAWSSDSGVWSQKTPSTASFIYRVWDFPFLPESIYRAAIASFEPVTSPSASLWEVGNTTVPVLPQFGLVSTNWLQAYILDGSNVIDYVQFAGPQSARDLNAEIRDPNAFSGSQKYMWSTNAYGIGNTLPTPTWGVVNQLMVSRNGNPPVLSSWKRSVNLPSNINTIAGEAAFFSGFYTPTYSYVNSKGQLVTAVNTNLVQQVPYTPTRMAWEYTLWQVNDPLVHYLASDLNATNTNAMGRSDDLIIQPLPSPLMNMPSDRYQPWGRASQMNELGSTKVDTSAYNMAFRDPLVWGSDFLNFPTNASATLDWLGRVHRGTPWQTVFLKATNVLLEPVNPLNGVAIGTNTWQQWTGDFNVFDAVNSAPVQDWRLAGLMMSLLNTNDLCLLLSVNNPDPNGWLVRLDGLTALTNTVTYPNIWDGPQFDSLVISSNSPAAAGIVASIQLAQGHRLFADAGDILAVSELAEQSPFLNWSDGDFQNYSISDEAYEKIPSQLLPLLRVDSVGSAVVANGQPLVQFTGYDGHAYVVQFSANLFDWVNVETNFPVNGTFSFTNLSPASATLQLYRSVLLPQ